MTSRHHIPVVITGVDELSREQAIQYVESVLAKLEDSDPVYRTFVEDEGIEDEEVERLLDMLELLDDDSIEAAGASVEEIQEDENT